MKTSPAKVLFPAKKYGWGWGLPCSWQGWFVYAAWLVLLCMGGIFLAPRSIGLYVAYAIAIGAVLFLVVFIKGEHPRWRWGEEENQQSRSLADRLEDLEELKRRHLVSESEYEAKRQKILEDV
jgi:hypothetical protein